MNVLDAADLTVHDYPGGSESLAPRMGMSAAILRGKVNTNNDRNHLTLADADRLMRVTGDHRILQALAAEHGYVLQRVEEGEVQQGILTSLLDLNEARGELSRAIREAVADDIISPNEEQAILTLSLAEQRTMISLMRYIRANVGKRGVA